MFISRLLSITLIIPAMILSYTDFLKESGPLQLQGVVIEAETGKPVDKAHLYVLQGTEEILSNSKGEFKLATWQKLPVTLTIAHSSYITETIKITDANEALKIRIRKK